MIHLDTFSYGQAYLLSDYLFGYKMGAGGLFPPLQNNLMCRKFLIPSKTISKVKNRSRFLGLFCLAARYSNLIICVYTADIELQNTLCLFACLFFRVKNRTV